MKIIHTQKAPEAIGPYSQAIVYNNILYTSGQIAINPENGTVEQTTIEGQTEQVMENLRALLQEAGTGFDKVIIRSFIKRGGKKIKWIFYFLPLLYKLSLSFCLIFISLLHCCI